jgi:hypothetical protein
VPWKKGALKFCDVDICRGKEGRKILQLVQVDKLIIYSLIIHDRALFTLLGTAP